MTENEIEFAEKIAARLGYKQTAYTSTSGLWGVFCLPNNSTHKSGCVIKTSEFGFMFVADLEDLKLNDLVREERKLDTVNPI